MRALLLSFTVLTAVAAAPAIAQTPATAPVAPDTSNVGPGNVDQGNVGQDNVWPGKVVTGPADLPSVKPLSHQASNINAANTRSVIAPALPEAEIGPNASATDYLDAARAVLGARQTGRAQSALENAETLLLTRSVPADATSAPSDNPAVHNVQAALQSLASDDLHGAMNLVQQTITMTQQADAGAPPLGMPPMGTGPMGAPPLPGQP